MLFFPEFFKKILQEIFAFFSEYASRDFGRFDQTRILRIRGSEKHARHARKRNCAGAHRAWFLGDIKIAVGKPPITDGACGLGDGDHLGMGGGILEKLGLIVGAGDHVIASHNHGAYWNVAGFDRRLCFTECDAHVKLFLTMMAHRVFLWKLRLDDSDTENISASPLFIKRGVSLMATENKSSLKSAYDLAMERLVAREGRGRTLSERQKQALAEVENKAKAKIAEHEIILASRLAGAAGDQEKIAEIKALHQREVDKIRSRMEEEKERIRQEGGDGN